MKPLTMMIVSLFLLLTACSKYSAQNGTDKEKNIDSLLTARTYVFKATSAQPARGRTIQLTSDYTFTVNEDTVISFLPYYGRAYSAPIGRAGGGIEFTSDDFTYNENVKKNGTREIEIVPKDAQDVQRVSITVSRGGYGSIIVNSLNRQVISFNGYIDSAPAPTSRRN